MEALFLHPASNLEVLVLVLIAALLARLPHIIRVELTIRQINKAFLEGPLLDDGAVEHQAK